MEVIKSEVKKMSELFMRYPNPGEVEGVGSGD